MNNKTKGTWFYVLGVIMLIGSVNYSFDLIMIFIGIACITYARKKHKEYKEDKNESKNKRKRVRN